MDFRRVSNEFSTDKKALIVLDIDGTLLDENYRINDLLLPSYISKLETEGIDFCINSNRSLHDLLPIAKQFNITGPLIGENGIFMYDSRGKTTSYFLTQPQLKTVKALKKDAEQELFNCLTTLFPNYKVYWNNTDTVDAISQHRINKYEERSVVVLNNKYREFTVSAHIKQVRGKELVSMQEEIASIAKQFQATLGNENTVDVAFSALFANILVNSHLTSKRNALNKLKDYILKDHDEVYVIGDEMSDFRMVEGIGTFLTTRNAPQKVQSKATSVSESTYSQGVTELLKQIF